MQCRAREMAASYIRNYHGTNYTLRAYSIIRLTSSMVWLCDATLLIRFTTDLKYKTESTESGGSCFLTRDLLASYILTDCFNFAQALQLYYAVL